MEKNKPYVIERDEKEVILNKITPQNPYLHQSSSTRQIRRGNERLNVIPMLNGESRIITERRVTSQKRKRNWIEF